MSGLLQTVKEEVEYMCVMKRSLDCNISNASFEEARMKALAAILEKIRSVGNVDTPEATECFSVLLDSHFLQGQRNQITEAVEFIRTGTGKKKTKTGHSFTQSCLGFHKLLTEDLWAQIQSCDDLSLVSALAVHMQNLGLVFANEPTYCSIGCTVAMARVLKAGEAAGNNYDINMIYSFTEALKRFIRVDRDRIRLPHYGQIITFPDDPAALKAQWPQIYKRAFGEGDPAKSIIDPIVLSRVCEAVPCRSTHRALNMTTKKFLQSALEGCAARRSPAEPELPGLKIYNVHPAASGHALPPVPDAQGHHIAVHQNYVPQPS
jgi:hypothetical protein